MIQEEKLIAALRNVRDPKTGRDLITENLVEHIRIQGENISFNLQVSAISATEKANLHLACVEAIQKIYPTADVHVHLVARTQTLRPQNTISAQIRNIIAVASGKGGVGKSTVATNLALGLQSLGAKVGLLDADIYGPSIPTMLGLQGKRPMVKDINGQTKIIPLEAYGLQTMSIGFIIEPEQAVVLRGPRLAAILKQFFNDCLWNDLDYLVIDLPPGTGDVQLTLVQTVPVTGVVMVTTPQEVALADAIKGMNMFLLPNVNVPILGVVENMAWFTPAELPNNKYYIFGEGGGKKLAKMANSVFLGQIPLVQSIRENGDAGKPSILSEGNGTKEYFVQIAKNTIRQIALRNELLEPTQTVKQSD